MRARLLGSLVVLSLVMALVPAVSGATSSHSPPLTVAGSSVSQSGQKIVWSVKLTAPFSPAAMKRQRRSLCLLIESPVNGSLTGGIVSGDLCVIPPRAGANAPRIVYQEVKDGAAGHAAVISATVTRPSTRELTASFLPGAFSNAYQPISWQVRSSIKPPGCTPVRRNPIGCLSLFPARPRLAALHAPQLAGCVPSGAAYVTNGPSNVHQLALTFDDGPWYDTPQFLDILEHYKVPATFFEIGDQIGSYGQGGAVERRMLADGDMIGDHTWNHADVSGAGAFAAGEIGEAASAIDQATRGFQPCLFRAPYGAVSGPLISQARSMGFTTIGWNVDPADWSRPGTASIYHTVTSTAHNGSIILQHDGGGDRSETLAALPQEIQTFEREGYKFVTVTQMLGQQLIYK